MFLKRLTDYERKTLADVVVSSDPELARKLHSRLDELLPLLPDVEQELLEFEARGILQKDVAVLYRSTQSAVSYRLHKARQRLKWLIGRPPKPASFVQDLEQALSLRSNRGRQRALGVAFFADITCQTTAGLLVCARQGHLREWVLDALAGLETLGLSETLAYLRYTQDTPNMLNGGIGTRLRSIVKPPGSSTREGKGNE